jgi:hypothetical protein
LRPAFPRVDHRCANAAARAFAGDDYRIHFVRCEMGNQRSAPERARRYLSDHGLTRLWRDLIDDVTAAALPVGGQRIHDRRRTAKPALSCPLLDIVGFIHDRHVDDRNRRLSS